MKGSHIKTTTKIRRKKLAYIENEKQSKFDGLHSNSKPPFLIRLYELERCSLLGWGQGSTVRKRWTSVFSVVHEYSKALSSVRKRRLRCFFWLAEYSKMNPHCQLN